MVHGGRTHYSHKLESMLTVPQAFGGLPMMPIQAMTQQATRHARRHLILTLTYSPALQSVATFLVKLWLLLGAPVKVRRPSDYNPSLAASLGPSHPSPHLNLAAVGLTPGASGGLEGPDRIFVGGLPYYCTELQARELLESFGALKGFDLVKDRETGNFKGYAFCVYQDVAVTDIACAALNGIKMGDKTLTVRRSLTNVVIPRPSPSGEPVEGLGKVFLKYGDTDGSSRARSGMNGRKFGGNEVVAVFYPEEKFDQGEYGA
ncbi:hypothetical protein Bca4012_086404 [Brassica carinata]